MTKLWLILTVAIVLALGAGAIWLMTWDIPAPTERVEKTLPDDRFPR